MNIQELDDRFARLDNRINRLYARLHDALNDANMPEMAAIGVKIDALEKEQAEMLEEYKG